MHPDLAHLDHLAAESRRFAAVLADTDPSARVPTCPDWTAADLLWHLTEVQMFWAGVAQEPLTDGAAAQALEAAAPPRPATHAEMLTVFTATTEQLLTALRRHEPATPAWSWHEPDQTIGFILRRQAHEALIHRVDAELTADLPVSPLHPALAADGIDEVLRVMWGVPTWATFYPAEGAVELVSTDTGHTWLVVPGRFVGTGPESGTEFDEPTAVVSDDSSLLTDAGIAPLAQVRGTAAALDRWVWNRGADAVQRSGDAHLLARLDELVSIGMQ